MLQMGHAGDLIEDKMDAVACLCLVEPPAEDEPDNLLLAYIAEKEMKEKQGSQNSYMDTQFLLATSNDCERIFQSLIGIALTTEKSPISPLSLEYFNFFCMQSATYGTSLMLIPLLAKQYDYLVGINKHLQFSELRNVSKRIIFWII